MKLLIATLVLSACAFAQATTITIQVGAGSVQTFTVPAAGTVSLNAYLPSQTNPDGSQRYATIHALALP